MPFWPDQDYINRGIYKGTSPPVKKYFDLYRNGLEDHQNGILSGEEDMNLAINSLFKISRELEDLKLENYAIERAVEYEKMGCFPYEDSLVPVLARKAKSNMVATVPNVDNARFNKNTLDPQGSNFAYCDRGIFVLACKVQDKKSTVACELENPSLGEEVEPLTKQRRFKLGGVSADEIYICENEAKIALYCTENGAHKLNGNKPTERRNPTSDLVHPGGQGGTRLDVVSRSKAHMKSTRRIFPTVKRGVSQVRVYAKERYDRTVYSYFDTKPTFTGFQSSTTYSSNQTAYDVASKQSREIEICRMLKRSSSAIEEHIRQGKREINDAKDQKRTVKLQEQVGIHYSVCNNHF
jgi:hypothetical protein